MNVAVLGLQWGDEGKGKAIDFLAKDFNVIVRYQGGHNAGHTIYANGEKVILHLLPSGIFTPGTVSVIGHGVVINPLQLTREIDHVQAMGVETGRLVVSEAAPLILPFHQQLDIIFENSRYQKIGTTRRGIGPAYEDLSGRRALFVRDIFDRDRFLRKVKPLNDYYNRVIKTYRGKPVEMDSYIDDYVEAGSILEGYADNTTLLLNRLARQGERMLFEGAQGTLLDINLGTYPFVTSSNPTIGGVFTGTGLPPQAVDRVVGITKSYATRVGEGPFPSEIEGDDADFLRKKGNEFGSTTGRPRRVGWLDLVALKYAIMVNGVHEIFMTKLDCLDCFEEIKVVTHYRDGNGAHQDFDGFFEYLGTVDMVSRTFPGWQSETGNIREYARLPERAQRYLEYLEKELDVPVTWISVGGGREQTIRRRS